VKTLSVFEWHKRFKGGCENVEDAQRSGRPRSHRTDDTVEKTRNPVHSDRHLSIRAVAVQLNLDKEVMKMPELSSNDWTLHNDSAPAHKTLSVKQLLPQKSSTEMEDPPCSRDFAPNDFWLFPQIKSALKV
jgi:hypothetical protein